MQLARRSFLKGATVFAASAAWPVALAQAPRAFTDATGRKLLLPSRVERIYAAGPPASILVFAIAPEKLIGWTTAWRDAERPFISKKYADLPTLGRLTGRGNTANVEVVLQAKPDVIIDYGTVNATLSSLADRVQQQTGIPYLLLDGDFDRMTDAISLIGVIAGEEKRAEALARYAQDTVVDINQRVAKIPAGQRPRVYYGRGPQGLNTGLAGSINAEFIEQLGAVNVAAELGKGGLVQVSIEQVLRWNPDVVVTIDPNFHALAAKHPLWRELPAIKAGRFHLAPNLPFGWIDFPPSINRLIGLRWLARILYPQVFPENLRPIVRDFYTRCYHQAPSEAQLDQLLRPA
ncbi:MAG TPA: iron ABC transporter substrate-binding protein [Burkholderiales bacterium]|nr:iron ABC transporter substrate-binding protein [Burkholderiales bacterium]